MLLPVLAAGAARQVLGGQRAPVIDQMLAGTAPARARQAARRPTAVPVRPTRLYRELGPIGFTGTGTAELTDRLVDDLINWDDADTITARLWPGRRGPSSLPTAPSADAQQTRSKPAA